MILSLALLLALAEPAPGAGRRLSKATSASQVSLAEAGRAIAAGRLDQAKSMLGVGNGRRSQGRAGRPAAGGPVASRAAKMSRR